MDKIRRQKIYEIVSGDETNGLGHFEYRRVWQPQRFRYPVIIYATLRGGRLYCFFKFLVVVGFVYTHRKWRTKQWLKGIVQFEEFGLGTNRLRDILRSECLQILLSKHIIYVGKEAKNYQVLTNPAQRSNVKKGI